MEKLEILVILLKLNYQTKMRMREINQLFLKDATTNTQIALKH